MANTIFPYQVKFYVIVYYVSGAYKVLYTGEDLEAAKAAYLLKRDHPKMDTVKLYKDGKVRLEYLGKNAIPRQ